MIMADIHERSEKYRSVWIGNGVSAVGFICEKASLGSIYGALLDHARVSDVWTSEPFDGLRDRLVRVHEGELGNGVRIGSFNRIQIHEAGDYVFVEVQGSENSTRFACARPTFGWLVTDLGLALGPQEGRSQSSSLGVY